MITWHKNRRVEFVDGGDEQLLSAGDVFAWLRGAGPGGWRIEVVATQGPNALALRSQNVLTLVLRSPAGELQQSLTLPGAPERWTIGAARRYAPVMGLIDLMVELAQRDTMEDEAVARQTLGADGVKRGRSSRAPLIISSVALVVSLFSLVVSGYGFVVSLAGSTQTMIAAPSQSSSSLSLQTLETKLAEDQLGPAGFAILKDAVARTGFSLNTNGALVVMFADPLCAACKQFEQWIAADDYKTFAPLVVPVAFQPGAADQAAAVLCSKEQARAWRKVIAGEKLEACEDGRRQLELNNAAFTAMGLSSTPTFIAMNGKILVGVRSPKEMAKWAAENTPAHLVTGADKDIRKPQN